MNRTFLLFVLAFSFTAKVAVSQDVIWTTSTENLSFLKDVKDVAVEFKYEIEKVNGTQTEAEFVAEQKSNRNLKGNSFGDKWEKDWYANRTFLFNGSFEQNFNKHVKEKLVLKEKCETCKYKIVIHIKAINTGKDNKVSTIIGQVPAGGDFWFDIIDVAQNSVVASFQINNVKVAIAPRNDDNFFPWINEAFAKAGRLAAVEILKKY